MRVEELFVGERFKLHPRVLSYSSTEGERTLGTGLRELPYLYGDILLLQENLPLKRLRLDRPALKNKDLSHRDHERNLKRKSTQLKDERAILNIKRSQELQPKSKLRKDEFTHYKILRYTFFAKSSFHDPFYLLITSTATKEKLRADNRITKPLSA